MGLSLTLGLTGSGFEVLISQVMLEEDGGIQLDENGNLMFEE